jgi:Short C-terminal domain
VAEEEKPKVPRELAGGNSLAAVYPGCSDARLYAAAVHAATGLGFAITNRDDAATTLSFRTGSATRSWPGQEMTAAIHPQGDAARVVVGGRPTTGYRLQMADWHQAKSVGLMFLKRLTAALPQVPEPARNDSSGPSRASQLRSLADLRDRGFLTEDEFAAAKEKLLD